MSNLLNPAAEIAYYRAFNKILAFEELGGYRYLQCLNMSEPLKIARLFIQCLRNYEGAKPERLEELILQLLVVVGILAMTLRQNGMK